ncbi:hypothetical protein SAMN02745784_01806 [Tissierella praeacuta DSM 18095]|uniref:ABC-2 family transporter protein n=1 Tax=Tissierella praeacuta DSM 18095 TaxID=1123404 RepID=A0A1M4W9M1_9FIRM|nr:hypothetical protein [Tissierella praeacuta]SHE77783.1 hypothetical protein SAMN02745784_01806 [Tissierella praeacuta DSM 18095]SUO99953.1 ABC-2 family transporter protein [Tissierella praeacuta]
MNRSILKHETRSMKWISLLSVIISFFIILMFSINLNTKYERMIFDGISGNETLIKDAMERIAPMVLVLFTVIAIIQVFMQFQSEKGQEIGRFLKALPIKREEFFKVKILLGLANITLGFIVLIIGLIVVRKSNMFWIKDIYKISLISEPFIEIDSVGTILKEMGIIYFVVISFYTFLFMIQYTFTHTVGGIVTGILIWLAPLFLLWATILTLGRFNIISIYRSELLNKILEKANWLLPWAYPIDYGSIDLIIDNTGRSIVRKNIIENLSLKYLVGIILSSLNITIAYKFAKNSKIEDENRIIIFKIFRQIFKFGVTICSGLLVSMIFNRFLMIEINNILFLIIILVSAYIGYFISNKITEVGNR